MTNNTDYEVGYGKPPKSGQFKKGKSGNPHGQSNKRHDSKSLVDGMFSEFITITINGKPARVTMREAILKQMINKAAAGDPRSLDRLLKDQWLRKNLLPEEAEYDNASNTSALPPMTDAERAEKLGELFNSVRARLEREGRL